VTGGRGARCRSIAMVGDLGKVRVSRYASSADMEDPSSKPGDLGSDDDPSVTDVAGPSIIRERTLELERGMVIGGRYQVEATIGKGGSGVVLRVFDRTAQSVVALKVLKPELVHDQRWSKRFSRELRLGRPIRHPNVCRIFDMGEADGHRFLTMELAIGGTLRDLVKKGGPLRPLAERLADASAVISGLAAIHEAGIVHRDVKPDNMLRMGDGRLALSDFGLATDLPADAGVTVMVGTPHYMAPEVRGGEPATARSDVWSLGVVLYEIFFGKRPERRSSLSPSGLSKPSTQLTSTALERAMLALCERCLADNPADRPADARAVLRLFQAARERPWRFMFRRRSVTAALAVVAVGVGGLLALKLSHRATGVVPGSPPPNAELMRISPTGDPADWTRSVRTIATVEGHAHCFSMLDAGTARLIWGEPRRAEDIDLHTGTRSPSDLLPETYALGCPERSEGGGALLFAATNAVGASEIRLSHEPSGAQASAVTPGSNPKWLRREEEFVYDVDPNHVAIYSLQTMRLNLLPEPGAGGHEIVIDKAVSPRGDEVAILIATTGSDRALALYDVTRLDLRNTFLLPRVYEAAYDAGTGDLLLSHQPSTNESALVLLDGRTRAARRLGRLVGFDILRGVSEKAGAVLLARRQSSDAWFYDERGRHRLSEGGQVYSAAVSGKGDVLLSRRGDDGRVTLWLRRNDGLEQVSSGPLDAMPDFAPDGEGWAYADYARKTIELCRRKGDCRSIARDRLPSHPRFSPDGKSLAFVTQVAPSRLTVISLADGIPHDLGSVYWQCPPVWTSSTSVWAVQSVGGRLSWSEHNLLADEKPGAGTPVAVDLEPSIATNCFVPDARPGTPFFQRVRVEVEEQTRVLHLDRRLGS
jgi:hypothetical protein